MGAGTADRDVAAATAAAAAHLLAGIDGRAERLSAHIHAAVDGFGADGAVTALSLAAIRAILVAVGRDLDADGRGRDTAPIRAPAEARRYAEEYVHRRYPLAVLLRTYLVGHEAIAAQWREVVAEETADAATALAVLDRTSPRLFRAMEGITTDVVDAYHAERERWTRSMAAIRAQAVAALLDGDPVDLAATERTLLYDLRDAHLSLVLWSTSDTPRPGVLDEAWAVVTAAVGDGPSLLVTAGRRTSWGWLGGPPARLEAVATRLATLALPNIDVRVVTGDPEPGLAGFRGSHWRALATRRTVEAAARPSSGVTRFSAVAVPALAATDGDAAAYFVRRELAGLAGDDTTALRLRGTLEVWFDEGGSPAGTARRLGIHVNTVAYRLRQAEALLGRSPTERRLELQLALRLARHGV